MSSNLICLSPQTKTWIIFSYRFFPFSSDEHPTAVMIAYIVLKVASGLCDQHPVGR